MADDARAAFGPPDAGEVIVVLTLTFKPGTRDRVLDGIVPAAQPTRAEAGNTQFDIFRVNGLPDQIVIFERWKSKAALQEHWDLSYAEQAVALFAENLVHPLVDGENVLYLQDAVSSL